MSTFYNFEPKTVETILGLLNQNTNIREIYNQLKEAKLFSKSEGTFRQLIKSEFRYNQEIKKWIYLIDIPSYLLWDINEVQENDVENHITSTPKNDDNFKPATSSPSINCEGKKSYIEKLNKKDGIVSKDNDFMQNQSSSSSQVNDENTKVILFKLNQLENKINKIDKFLNQIAEDKYKMHFLSKLIISSISEALNEKK